MSSMSPPPQRPSLPGYSDHALANGQSVPAPGSDVDALYEQSLSVADFFAQALEGAMALVRADGGEIATLDDTRHILVLRARRTRPRLDAAALGPMGMPSRASQPVRGPGASYVNGPLPGSSHAGFAPASRPSNPGYDVLAGIDDEAGEIEIQSTLLLPATMISRTYRKGERLIGYTWERAEPVMMNNEQCRALPAGSAPADPDAPHHLAVPILRPSSLAMIRPTTAVIGVISVYVRDPLWGFTPRDTEQLTLHADRVGRAMRVADLSRQNLSQKELLDLLASSDAGGQQALYPRLRDVVRHLIDAPSFAVLRYDERQDTVTFELAERDGQPLAGGIFPATALPPWWDIVCNGSVMRISAPEDRAAHPEYCMLGWGSDQPVASILAAPLISGNRLVGAIIAGSPRADAYAMEHGRLFATIARSATIIIENARLARETHQSLARTHDKQRQLSILNNAVLTLNASLDTDEALKALVKQAGLLTEAKSCVVFLLDESEQFLVGRATNATPDARSPELQAVRVPVAWRGLGAMLNASQFTFLDDLESEWEDGTELGRLLAREQIRAALVLPIQRKDPTAMARQETPKEGPLGILVVYTHGNRHHFQPEEIGLLQALVSQASVAINNALLFQEQQRLNTELQEAFEKQKELDRLKDEFILTVSHEFRTPVTAIEGYVTLIGRHGHKLEQAKLDSFAGEIHQATNQLMGMINMLHDANSMSDQPLQLTLHPVNIRQVAEAAIATQSPEAKARMMLQMPPQLWMLADNERLKHVFTNLLSNAIKYSPSDTSCQVTARLEARETLAAQHRPHAMAEGAADRWVVAGVRDWGSGITPDDQTKLFQKFVRLSRSLTTSVRGTGLGLWICRQYVEAMGGDIWVESEYGKGAHFQFSLPYVAPSEHGG